MYWLNPIRVLVMTNIYTLLCKHLKPYNKNYNVQLNYNRK